MHERLVESWLDSASERSYQAPFCQMLAADGHRIVHSTRHSPIELGKDIITVDPEKQACAYQLKGNPGGRLTLHDFRAIQDQLRQLTDAALTHPELAGKQHKSFLVTNGLVEEETTLAIREMNQAQLNAGYTGRELYVIQRGDLLDMAKRLGHSLWPSEIQQTHLLLEMLVEDGAGSFPPDRWNEMLSDLLGLGASAPRWKAPELKRRVASGAILTALALKNYESRDNHFASVSAWVQYAACVIASCERHHLSYARNGSAAVSIALATVRDSLVDLAKEALDRRVLLEGDAMLDAAFYRARYTLILGLLSLLWFWCEQDGWPDDLSRDELEQFLTKGKSNLYLWGEAAIPQILAYYWFLRRNEAGAGPDQLLSVMLRAVTRVGSDGEPLGLPDPYWDFDSVARHQLAPILGWDEDELSRYATGRQSYFAESLLHLLVRTNLKNECRTAWPAVSRLMFADFAPRDTWQYCLSTTMQGTVQLVQPPLEKDWHDLVEEARSVRCQSAPKPMLDLPFLHWLFVILFPYRARPDVVRRTSRLFNRAWLISGEPIE